MKKFALLLILLCIMTVPVVANTVIGDSVYTDIVTYINHYPIPSYNFNGNTLIAAEDLTNYGFDVFWNEYANSLSITRNPDKNDINPLLTFRPAENKIGSRELQITTTDVKVYTGNHIYSSYGGIYGKTLINVNDLACIDNVSVNWVPEVKAVKIWVTDGLQMSQTHYYEVRRLDSFEYYENCVGVDNTCLHNVHIATPEMLVIISAETVGKNTTICTDCIFRVEIIDVIDSDGYSRLSNGYHTKFGYSSLAPYCYGYTNYPLSNIITITNEDLLPHTASGHGGLVKLKYSCSDSNYDITLMVDCLPYE